MMQAQNRSIFGHVCCLRSPKNMRFCCKHMICSIFFPDERKKKTQTVGAKLFLIVIQNNLVAEIVVDIWCTFQMFREIHIDHISNNDIETQL